MGDNSIKIVCVPSAKGPTVKEKNFFPLKIVSLGKGSRIGAVFFSFCTVDPFSERAWGSEEQTGSLKSCLPCKNGGKSTKCMESPQDEHCPGNSEDPDHTARM